MDTNTILIVVIFILVAFLLFMSYQAHYYYKKSRANKYRVDVLKAMYRERQGGTTKYPSYRILSFDYGNTWYAIERESDTATILGPAEEIYPGLLKSLEQTDRLIAHVKEHGPIQVGPNTDFGELAKMGITVKTKEPSEGTK